MSIIKRSIEKGRREGGKEVENNCRVDCFVDPPTCNLNNRHDTLEKSEKWNKAR